MISPNWQDTTANEVADFLASGQVKLPNSYRVLNADGSIPAEGMLNSTYRGVDLHSGWPARESNSTPDGHASKRSA